MWWVAQWLERLNILIHPLPEKADELRVIACQAGGGGFDSRSTTPINFKFWTSATLSQTILDLI